MGCKMKLLTEGKTNTKLAKRTRQTAGLLNFILHLAPSDLSGRNTCPNASTGCKATCLNTAGRGQFNSVQQARIRKTKYFFEDRQAFLDDLFKDLCSALAKAKRQGKKCVVRLNGTSDIPWESIMYYRHDQEPISLISLFPEIQFYDYTKSALRVGRWLNSPIKNLHLTFSRSENNESACLNILDQGVNVAVVFRGAIPAVWRDRIVISGDDHDYRFLDPKGVVVGLSAKGRARKDVSGFVVG